MVRFLNHTIDVNLAFRFGTIDILSERSPILDLYVVENRSSLLQNKGAISEIETYIMKKSITLTLIVILVGFNISTYPV